MIRPPTPRSHPAPTASPEGDVWDWLLRLRWGASLGQLVAILLGRWLLGIALPLAPLLLLVGLAVVSNVWLERRRWQQAPMTYGLMTLVLVTDLLQVTGLLALTGGPSNPFATIYTVHVALAATMLPNAGVAAVMAAAFGGFASLFLWHTPLPAVQESSLYLRGLACAFCVAVLFIAYFVRRIQQALARAEARLALARERAVRDEKLSSLATLAAGAAHELSTPLATIAVAAKEMERRLQSLEHDALREDARLIRQEVDRCRDVLRHMAHDAGETNADGFVHIDPTSLVQEALQELQRGGKVSLQVDPVANGAMYLPVRSVVHSLRAVVHNALDASAVPAAHQGARPPEAARGRRVAVRVAQVDNTCYISVADRGCGMPRDVLARAGEPFFTTKGPGRGMGLGLFLARTVLERLGGGLRVESDLGSGTTVVLRLPLANEAPEPWSLNR